MSECKAAGVDKPCERKREELLLLYNNTWKSKTLKKRSGAKFLLMQTWGHNFGMCEVFCLIEWKIAVTVTVTVCFDWVTHPDLLAPALLPDHSCFFQPSQCSYRKLVGFTGQEWSVMSWQCVSSVLLAFVCASVYLGRRRGPWSRNAWGKSLLGHENYMCLHRGKARCEWEIKKWAKSMKRNFILEQLLGPAIKTYTNIAYINP